MAELVLEFRNLCKSFERNGNEQLVLRGVNLKVFEGEFVCVLGESGGGKSVLMEHINGNNVPDSGEVYLFGENVHTLGSQKYDELIRKTGYVFQGNALFGWLNVYENIALWFREHDNKTEQEISDVVRRVLDEVDLDFDSVRDKKPSELSGGMKKRAAIARTIAYKPKIIVYDEPTTGLPPGTVLTITDLIRKLHDEGGRTSIVVTHDLPSVARLNGRIALIKNGVLICYDNYTALWNSTDPKAIDYIGRYKEEQRALRIS